MQRITCKTAELAVKKSYPICRDKYYPVQYSYGDSVKGKNAPTYEYSKETCELYTDIIPALYQEELAEWLRTKNIFITLLRPNKRLTKWYGEVWYIENENWHTDDYQIEGSSFEKCFENGLRVGLSLLPTIVDR